MEEAVAAGEASRRDYSMLYDRVQKSDGKPQRWGNATSCVNGKAVLDPVEDPARLAERRQALSRPPIEEYLKTLNVFCAAERP